MYILFFKNRNEEGKASKRNGFAKGTFRCHAAACYAQLFLCNLTWRKWLLSSSVVVFIDHLLSEITSHLWLCALRQGWSGALNRRSAHYGMEFQGKMLWGCSWSTLHTRVPYENKYQQPSLTDRRNDRGRAVKDFHNSVFFFYCDVMYFFYDAMLDRSDSKV